MKRYKKAIKSLSYLWIGSLVGSGSTFIIYTILARKLGPESFGIFSSAIASITIFSLIAGFGISQTWLKVFGQEGWQGIRWIKPSLVFVMITLFIVTLSLIAYSNLGFQDEATRQLLVILILHIYGFVGIDLVAAKLQLEERYQKLAFWQLSPNLLRLMTIFSVFYILKRSMSLMEIGLVYAIVGIIFSLLAIWQMIKMSKGEFILTGHGKRNNEYTRSPRQKEVFKEVWPFGMANLLAFIYVQSDIIMVRYLANEGQAGLYNVAFVVLTAILLIPSILFGKFLLPKYHRWANQDTQKFLNIYKQSNIVMLLSGVGVMILVLLSSSYFIPLIFGNQYLASVTLMNILMLTLPISFLAYSVGAVLVTSEHMKKKVKLMGVVALVNIVLNLILIPYYGAKGAAISTVSSNALLLALYYWSVNRNVFVALNPGR